MQTIMFIAIHYGFVISLIGFIFSLALLRHPDRRRESRIPALICLLCSILYFSAFVYTTGEEHMHAWFGGADKSRAHAGIETPPRFS